MKNKPNLITIVGIVLILTVCVAFYISWRERRAITLFPNLSSDQLLAEADKQRTDAGLPVRLELAGKTPYGKTGTNFITNFIRLEPNEVVDAYLSCAQKPTPPTGRSVACWNGRKNATAIEEHMRNAATSIQEIKKMLSAVKNFLDTDLNKRTTIDGLSVFIIPGGRDTNSSFTLAENIEMKCLRDRAVPNGKGAVTPIGRKASGASKLFNNAPPDLVQDLAAMRKSNAETNAKIEPKLASKDAKLTNEENISLIKTALSLHDALSGKHIGVTQEMLNSHYSVLVQRKVPIFFQAYKARDKNGNTINCNSKLSTAARVLAWGAGFGGDYFLTNLKIDGLGYTRVCIPDASLLAVIKKDMQTHVERLEKLQAGHEARKEAWEIKLQTQIAAIDKSCSP